MICAVVPTYNSQLSLPILLAQLGGTDRVVISDGGSEDKTLPIAVSTGAVIAIGKKGRGHQLRRGARWAGDCDWLLVLHSDCQLPENWCALTAQHIKQHPNTAGYFDLRFDSTKISARIIECLVRIRCAAFSLPYGDQGLLIPRALYDQVGGYPALSLFEDVALIKTLGKQNIRRLGGALVTNAGKYERDGFLTRGWRNFRLLRRYLKGERPEDIAKDYP